MGGTSASEPPSVREMNFTPDSWYWDNGRIRGRCSVCGDTKQHKQKKNPKYWRPWYFRILQKVDEFRGNDEYLGMICNQCIKDGKVRLVNKFHPNQLKDK